MKVRAELASLNRCAVPFLSRALTPNYAGTMVLLAILITSLFMLITSLFMLITSLFILITSIFSGKNMDQLTQDRLLQQVHADNDSNHVSKKRLLSNESVSK